MSVGREVCKTMIDAAERMRRYSASVAEFDTPEAEALAEFLVERAARLEALVPSILAFEGENPKLLTAGAAS